MVCPARARRRDQALPVPAGSKPDPRTGAAPTLSAAMVRPAPGSAAGFADPVKCARSWSNSAVGSAGRDAAVPAEPSPGLDARCVCRAAEPWSGLVTALSSRRCAAPAAHDAQMRLVPNPPRMAASTCRRHELPAPNAGRSRRVPSSVPGSSIEPRARTGNGCDGRRLAGGRGGPSLDGRPYSNGFGLGFSFCRGRERSDFWDGGRFNEVDGLFGRRAGRSGCRLGCRSR